MDRQEENKRHDRPEQQNHMEALVGSVFADKYEIISVIGQGGMSTVYKARHKYMERLVAVKVLHPHLTSDPISIARFQQEAKAASSLSHPNIITVYDFGVTQSNRAYLVMDYLEGITLGEVLDSGGALTEHDTIDITRQLAKGLSHAHSRNVVHRDLKPRNIVLTVEEDGSVLAQIVDFGIAKIVASEGEESQHLTATGEVFGSPIYMSPEQCSGNALDQRSDIYSLGCVMYEALTGAPPFLGSNPVETMSMHVEDEPISISEAAPGLTFSRKMQKCVSACLRKDLNGRYQTVLELLEDLPDTKQDSGRGTTVAVRLSDIVTSGSSAHTDHARIKKTPRRRRRSIKPSARVLAIVFGIGFVGLSSILLFYQGPDEDPGSPFLKIKWQALMSLADWQIKNKQYAQALPILSWAVSDAENLTGGGKNFDKLKETLRRQIGVCSALGMTARQEQATSRLVSLDRKRYQDSSRRMIEKLDNALSTIQSIEKTGQNPKDFSERKELNLVGDVVVIVELARRLDAVKDYELEEDLLKKADAVLSRVYGDNFIGLTSIKLQLADCLRKEDRIVEIKELRLYERTVEIEKLNLEAQARNPKDSPGYIQSLLKLGQWQRDRSQFALAEPNLRQAMKLAQECKSLSPAELAEHYNSFADFLRQTGRTAQARTYENKALKLKKSAGRS